VANRTGLASGRTVEAVEKKLLQVTPAQFLQHAHHWLILHGRHVCQARKPRCPVCVIAPLCDYRPKTAGERP
jgi:endonuclease-3